MTGTRKWFVRGDIDGFFGLFVDNLLQLMLIYELCIYVCKLPVELVTGKILPAAGLSILFGNAYYTYQARKLMVKTGRDDITALPYGINTMSLFAYVFIVMTPIYHQTQNPELAWQAGLFACFFSGVIECFGSFFGDWIRRNTPRAALLSALGGIAITFISMDFVFRLFANPLIAIAPALIILITYASKVKLPGGIPGGLLAITVGTGLAWLMRYLELPSFTPNQVPFEFQVYYPIPVFGELFASLGSELGWSFISVIILMGLFNALGSLQNLESAAAAGDDYPTRPCMMANGLGTLVASFFGSPFPTTIYIGHPAWKAMGARAGYSLVNGIVMALLCFFGGILLILKVVPLEATLGILLWIGILITAQCFQEVPKHHALAVSIGLVPSLAAWMLVFIENSLRFAGTSLYKTASVFTKNNVFIEGIIALSQGFLLTSICFSAIMVYLCEKNFLKAGIWTTLTAFFAQVGLIHAFKIGEFRVENVFGLTAGWEFGSMYMVCAIILFILHYLNKNTPKEETIVS